MKITLKGVVKVLTTIAGVLGDILPIIRRVSPQVEETVGQIEHEITEVGEDAAAWINAHPEVIAAMHDIGDRLMNTGSAFKTLALAAHAAAVNNVVDIPESEQLVRCLDMIRKAALDLDALDDDVKTILAAK